jgi:biofilm PGA synthesis N-glycosyltransferase PgaC
MKTLFWSCLFLVLFTYVGYPLWMFFRALFWPRPNRRGDILPRVSMVLAAYNEEENLPNKLRNLSALDYPLELLELVIVSDGSTDDTNNILASWRNPSSKIVILPEHRGKAIALNHGIAEAQGEIICFTDARQTIAVDALKKLVANFADPSVGCVSGALMIGENPTVASSDGVGLYWRIERCTRNWEGLAGSTVGATGAFYAVRKRLLLPLPPNTILDDVYIPFQVVRQGQRVILDPRSLAWDHVTPGLRQEFRRKVRTLTGNYQLLRLAPWLLTRVNPLRVQLVCHKLLRLVIPFALLGMLVSTVSLHRGLYELALVLQLAFYALATLRIFGSRVGFVSRLSSTSLAFVVLNTAAAVALIYFITGKKSVWVP